MDATNRSVDFKPQYNSMRQGGNGARRRRDGDRKAYDWRPLQAGLIPDGDNVDGETGVHAGEAFEEDE